MFRSKKKKRVFSVTFENESVFYIDLDKVSLIEVKGLNVKMFLDRSSFECELEKEEDIVTLIKEFV